MSNLPNNGRSWRVDRLHNRIVALMDSLSSSGTSFNPRELHSALVEIDLEIVVVSGPPSYNSSSSNSPNYEIIVPVVEIPDDDPLADFEIPIIKKKKKKGKNKGRSRKGSKIGKEVDLGQKGNILAGEHGLIQNG